MISRPLPLITHRIEFSSKVLSTAPVVTSRLEFGQQTLKATVSYLERELTPSDHGNENSPLNKDVESELSDLSDIEEAPTTSKKIAKPSGEPGRPGSGGYSIEDALASWGKEEVLKVNKLVKKLADLKLDKTKSYSKQNGKKVNDIYNYKVLMVISSKNTKLTRATFAAFPITSPVNGQREIITSVVSRCKAWQVRVSILIVRQLI
ncbi:hypothetical protein GALMADRAFT_214158 [Galerina marginata CBS 339.88]|uniref:Uncharacterized protein n=1 Tax=Galerina marginata (strain CBS 339.88) TaxID=685588 RepID=A0A067SMB4_GALM3|nr:hypothetical protein GALMADRAFT_214158 [Galerina marginata CBS 339.88]